MAAMLPRVCAVGFVEHSASILVTRTDRFIDAVPAFGGVSSVQPSKDISGCKLYQGEQCDTTGGNIPDVAYPGIADLREYGLNDDINSFICY